MNEKYDEAVKKVDAMTLAECRTRLAEIKQMAREGDFSYSYDEYLLIVKKVPEENARLEHAMLARDAQIKRLRLQQLRRKPRSK